MTGAWFVLDLLLHRGAACVLGVGSGPIATFLSHYEP